MLILLRRLLSRLFPTPKVIGVASVPEPAPEPVTDPLDPAWRPSGELVEPLFFQRATPSPPTWNELGFTQAWATIKPAE